MKRAMILGVWICGVLGLKALAQEAAFTNFVEGAKWSVPGNWDPNTVPGVGWTASLTNRTGVFAASYAVDYDAVDDTFRNNALLNMIHTAPHTVTLNVISNMTPNASRFLLQMNGQSIVNVATGKLMRFISSGTTLSGQMNIYGTMVAGMAHATEPTHLGIWTVQDGGTLLTDQTINASLTMSTYGAVVVESGGTWTNQVRDLQIRNQTVNNYEALTVRGDFVHAGARHFIVGTDSSSSIFPVARVEGNGRFLIASAATSMQIGQNWSSHGGGRFFLTDNGSVINRTTLWLGPGREHADARTRDGRVYIQGGQWVNTDVSKMVLIGGWDPFATTVVTVSENNRSTVVGWLEQSDGICDIRGNMYVANGPSTGRIRVSGGDFFNTNATGTATMRVGVQQGSVVAAPGSGTLEISGGTARVDRLIATNGVNRSTILLSGGALTLGGSTINTGSALAVGNGAQPVSLILLGGGHAIANGLTVNTNATLALRGLGAGSVAVAGNVTFEKDAVLQVAVTDTADQLAATGSAVLNGQLAIAPQGDYEPSDGLQWTVLTASGGISGTFSSVTEGYKAEVLGGDTLVVTKSRAGTVLLLR